MGEECTLMYNFAELFGGVIKFFWRDLEVNEDFPNIRSLRVLHIKPFLQMFRI